MVIRRRVIVRGMVQGVFFRDTCRHEAIGRGVAGWVRNRSDGTVEAVFEGPASAVEAMCEWCETGPPHARVAGVEITEEPTADATGFSVRP